MVDMIFYLKWKSEFAMHTDGYQASRMNIWRDFLPPHLLDKIMDKQAGERIEVRLKAGDILPPLTNRVWYGSNEIDLNKSLQQKRLQPPESAGSIPRAC